jgi:hypothetical protein
MQEFSTLLKFGFNASSQQKISEIIFIDNIKG